MTNHKYVGVLGGGGSLGADTIGKLKKLQPNYDAVICTSTGALMGGLVLLKKYDRLEEAYTTTTQQDIFNINPFKKDGSIRKGKLAWRIARGKVTLGESKPLIDLVKRYFTYIDYKLIKELQKEYTVVVQEMSPKGYEHRSKKRYISIYDYEYDEFCQFIAASASVQSVFSLIRINGRLYGDGGLTETVALKKALDFNPENIDVFTHDKQPLTKEDLKKLDQDKTPTPDFCGSVPLLERSFVIQREEIQKDDLKGGIDINNLSNEKAEINVYYLSEGVDYRAMEFNPEKMKQAIELGYNSI